MIWKTFSIALASVLLSPTLVLGYFALKASHEQLAIALGVWMFVGLVPAIIGSWLLFKATRA